MSLLNSRSAAVFAMLTVFLFVAAPASSATWSILGFQMAPQDAPKVLTAFDELMASDTGKRLNGRIIFQASGADGRDPTTHRFVPIFETAADAEKFTQSLADDPAWSAYLAKVGGLMTQTLNVRFRTLQSSGDINDTDSVWMLVGFNVSDPAGFVAAGDRFRATDTFKRFPGQVHLSAVVAAGLSPVTHVLSVGFASEAEMDAWQTSLAGSADWAAYQAAAGASAEMLGTSLARDIREWGKSSLEDLTSP